MRGFFYWTFVILYFATPLLFAESDNSYSGQAFDLNIENDSHLLGGPGSDDAYTSGVRLSYILAENQIPDFSTAFFDWSEDLWNAIKSSSSNVGFVMGQEIYSPNNLQDPNLDLTDRPYAAWLYFGMEIQFKNAWRSRSLELDLGYVGPEALGEQAQNGVHRLIGDQTAKGWQHQLGSEPTLQLFYQQREKYWAIYGKDEKRNLDIIPYFGGSLGNVAIDAHVGGLARLGINLPGDFGPTGTSSKNGDSFVMPTKSQLPTSVYLLAGAKLTAVARNIFLDGNTFHPSYHVTKYPLVTESEIGIGSVIYRWELTWRFITRSPEFRERNNFDSFASISISKSF